MKKGDEVVIIAGNYHKGDRAIIVESPYQPLGFDSIWIQVVGTCNMRLIHKGEYRAVSPLEKLAEVAE